MFRELLWSNKTVIAASSAAVVGVIAGYPFDSVKTRMQTEPYGSITACVRQTYREEGVRGFFRGVLPPLVTVSIIKSISFSVYEETKSFCKSRFPYLKRDELGPVMSISTLGGAFELVKIHKQLEFLLLQASSISTGATVVRENRKKQGIKCNLPKATSSWHSAKEIVRLKGIRGLWSGFGLHFVRDVIGTGVYFGGYETTKFLLSGPERTAGPMTQFLAGGVCGILCWLAVFPIDLVKSLMQKEILAQQPTYKSTMHCVRDIYKSRGPTGFYRGIAVTLLRAFPLDALMIKQQPANQNSFPQFFGVRTNAGPAMGQESTLGYGTLEAEEYDRPSDQLDADVQEMVSRMTLEEKIGQMTQINQDLVLGEDGVLNRTAVEHYAQNYYVGSYLNQLARDGINFDHQEYAKTIEEIQEITLGVNSTYKIPIIYGLDHIHGAHYVAKSTIFAHGVNLGASFNPKLSYDTAAVTARETRAANVHWTFAPVLDIPMSKQWARVFENFGEDPYMSGVMGAAAVRGYQGKYKTDRSKVAASMKHFIAYGAPYSGQDRDTTIVSDRIVHDYFVPGFKEAVDAGVATAMESYIDVNGEPVVASHKYLQEMLREQLQFKGMLVTDWAEIENLYTTHKVAASHRDAVRLSIGSTSVDMSMVPSDVIFFDELKQLVLDGVIDEARINESAGRLLQLKKDLGLLEPDGWKVDPNLAIGLPEDIELARDAARESVTLLKNENDVLPFKEDTKRVLIVGPTGDTLSHLAGGWTIYWQGATDDGWQGNTSDEQFYSNGTTIHNGVRAAAPEGTTVEYMQGFDIEGNDINMAEVIAAAADYDVIVATIGEHVYSEAPGDIHDIRLPLGQAQSVRMLAGTGKPVVSILVEGRPRTLDSIPEDSDALVQAYLPGPWGGHAIGEILFGKVNPSGRLPYTYPKYAGDINLSYWRQANDVWDPLYEFGHGLSYTKFTYSNITLAEKEDSNSVLEPGMTRTVSIRVTNEGPYDGLETVLMFIHQPVRLVTPPAKLLKGFEKIQLAAGESKTVDFEVGADMFRYTGLDDVPQGTIDNGPVKILIGEQQFDFEIRV
ncbi:glycoside hydrolase superfamily [Zychaea mexicana]|uniref:glycoside hydrolase superfamily n=1 Tax=Zychaea mexicana TaxID=64656 RepID=UPI0022FEB210|nr:glycoside hydrolase superfamily [Zychaea mexicana]KAI9488005.1 glycoside hydrolase superfamily [Zychaea mexicana]